MKRILVLGLIVFSGILNGASPDPEDAWFKTFYKTDNVERFDSFWKRVLPEKHLEIPNAVAPTVGFASQVLHRHPKPLSTA